jgi:hypothetical protein
MIDTINQAANTLWAIANLMFAGLATYLALRLILWALKVRRS